MPAPMRSDAAPAPSLTIADLRLVVADIPVRRPHHMSFTTLEAVNFVFVRLETREGHVGWGEAACLGGPTWSEESAESVAATIERYLAPWLRGADATPSRVLLAMRDAAVIELHTHGFIANDVSEASYLVLSPELDEQYAMTARDVAGAELTAAPLVILGACHAAASSRSLEGGIGLAEAFRRAGAGAVIASPDPVQDLGAYGFFTAVRERVAAGADPAVALRDERVKRLAERDSWVAGVVVFE